MVDLNVASPWLHNLSGWVVFKPCEVSTTGQSGAVASMPWKNDDNAFIDWLVKVAGALVVSALLVLLFFFLMEDPGVPLPVDSALVHRLKQLVLAMIPDAIVALLALPTAYFFFTRHQSGQQPADLDALVPEVSKVVAAADTVAHAANAIMAAASAPPAEAASAADVGAAPFQIDRSAIHERLVATLVAIDRLEGPSGETLISTPWYRIGVHVWLIPSAPTPPPENYRPNMYHLLAFRAKDTVLLSGIKWYRGKGVIGVCWENRNFVYFDFNIYKGYTKAQWEDLPEQDRLNMSYSEMQLLADKYGAVIAAPLCCGDGDEQLIGCLVVDTPPGYSDPLNDDEVLAVLVEAGKKFLSPLLTGV